MADIIKDSFVESNNFRKVLFQRNRQLIDFELNELQDDIRVPVYRTMYNAIQKSATQVANPGSNDTGFQVQGTSATNAVTVAAGYVFCDGIEIHNASPVTLSGFVTPGSPTVDVVYLSVSEIEVADPAQLPAIGETTRRRQLTYTINIASGTGPSTGAGTGGVPINSSSEIWQGGTHQFVLANITRDTTGVIQASQVSDFRGLLPSSVLAQTTIQSNGAVAAVTKGSGWTATVGDGVATFGDYNGATAIQTAINAATAAGALGVHIIVKPGSYTIPNSPGISLPNANTYVLIEGYGHAACTVTFSGSTSPAAINLNASSTSLELRGLTLTSSTTFVRFIDFSSGRLILRDCFVTNGGFTTSGGSSVTAQSFYAADCYLNAYGESTPTPFITVNMSAALQKLEFERCYIATAVNTPAVSVAAASAATLEGVYFRDCLCYWGKATTSSGNLGGNPTGVDVITGSNNYVVIGEVSYKNCDVYPGQGNTGSDSNILIHMIPYTNGDSSGAHYATVQRVTIEGGHWYSDNNPASPYTTAFNPFTLVANRVTIKDLTIDSNTVYGGAPTADVAHAFGGAAPATADWAQVVINAQQIAVDGLYLTGMPRQSGSGDLWITNVGWTSATNNTCHVRNVSLSGYTYAGTGTTNIPHYRAMFTGPLGASSIYGSSSGPTYRNLAGSETGGQAVFEKITLLWDHAISSGDNVVTPSSDLYGYLVLGSNTVLRDATIQGAKTSSGSVYSDGSGICVRGFYGYSTDATFGPAQDITIDNCTVFSCHNGVDLAGGFSAALHNVHIIGGSFHHNKVNGIYLNPPGSVTDGTWTNIGCTNVSIDGADSSSNGDVTNSIQGYGLSYPTYTLVTGCQLSIRNCTMINNNGAGSGSYTALAAAVQANLTYYGGTTTSSGLFIMNNNFGAGILAVLTTGGGEFGLGYQTGYAVSGAATTTPSFTNNAAMIHNYGTLNHS